MLTNFLIILVPTITLSVILVALLKRFALKSRLLIPQGIPLVGGLGMGLAFVVGCILSIIVFGRLHQTVRGILISSIIMLCFGLIDDYRELSILAKFLVQIIATSILIFFGIRTQIVLIGDLANIFVTFVWILAITNAFNHLDVTDGVAAVAAFIAGLSLFVISILNKDIATAILTLGLVGSIFGFLIYNLPPAKVYMGNSGSHFLGFTLASIALIISYAPLERKIALLSPIVILGLPIFDTAYLIFVRLSKKKLPFKKTNDHIVLRLLKLGYSKEKVLLCMAWLCLLFSFSGILLSQVSNQLGAIIIISVITVILIMSYKVSKVKIDD